MINYRKLEKAIVMILNRNIELAGYSKIQNDKYDENGNLKVDTNLKISYDNDNVIRIYDDGIFVLGFSNGWIFSYVSWFKRDRNMKKFVKGEFKRINKAYDEQVKIDNEYLKNKYKGEE